MSDFSFVPPTSVVTIPDANAIRRLHLHLRFLVFVIEVVYEIVVGMPFIKNVHRSNDMYIKKRGNYRSGFLSFGDPHGARTHDPNIKSVVLYQLS